VACNPCVVRIADKARRAHILSDLRAYVCTFEECSVGLFESRSSWFLHELEAHRAVWQCPSCLDDEHVYPSRTSLADHLQKSHPDRYPAEALDSIIDASSKPATQVSIESACPLCDDVESTATAGVNDLGVYLSMETVKHHKAAHLEALALFATGPTDEDTLESQTDDDQPLEGTQLQLSQEVSQHVCRVFGLQTPETSLPKN